MEKTTPPARPTGVRRLLFRLPLWLYRARLGGLLGQRLVLINHLGRKSGLRRQAVVEVVHRDAAAGTLVVAAGFGPRTDWYRNLLAHPDVTVQLGRRNLAVRATAIPEEEAADAMVAYARRHPRAARALARFMGYRVDGSDADFRAVGSQVPMLRLGEHSAPV